MSAIRAAAEFHSRMEDEKAVWHSHFQSAWNVNGALRCAAIAPCCGSSKQKDDADFIAIFGEFDHNVLDEQPSAPNITTRRWSANE